MYLRVTGTSDPDVFHLDWRESLEKDEIHAGFCALERKCHCRSEGTLHCARQMSGISVPGTVSRSQVRTLFRIGQQIVGEQQDSLRWMGAETLDTKLRRAHNKAVAAGGK